MTKSCISTGASASRQGARYLLRRGLEGKAAEKIVTRIAGHFVARNVSTTLAVQSRLEILEP